MPMILPSPLAGLSEATGTLADAIIQGRERQALNQDMSLIGEAAAGGDEAAWQDTLAKMKTTQGKQMAIKMMAQSQPTPLYGYEGGEVVQKGTMPARGQLLKPDPAAAQLALEEKRQQGREKMEGMKEDTRNRLEEQRQAAWEARDQRRYDLSMDLADKRAALQEKIKEAKTDKDRSEISRKDLLSVRQRAKENYNRQVGNIRKQFTDIGGGVTEPDKMQAALDAAQRDYQQDLDMVHSAYGDVIDKYKIPVPGRAAGVQKAGEQPQITREAVKTKYQNLLQSNPEAAKIIAAKYPWLAQ